MDERLQLVGPPGQRRGGSHGDDTRRWLMSVPFAQAITALNNRCW